MFGPALRQEIEQFIKTVHISCMYMIQEIKTIRREQIERRNSFSFIKKLFNSLFEDKSPEELKLQEISKVPGILETAVSSLCQMFQVSYDAHSLLSMCLGIDLVLILNSVFSLH